MKKTNVYKDLNLTYSFYSRFLKRFFDFLISLIMVLVLSPILLILYILTLIFNGAPALYKQARPGKNHKIFYIYKFRSMNNKKDKNGNLLPDAERITKFGKFLRKSSLDELPQLFNILKGDMSFIGPRPRLVKDMLFYPEDVYPYYIARPGLTGPTQTTGRNQNTWEQVFEKDIEYLHHVTFWNDIKIFFKTFTSVFTSTGQSHAETEEDKQKEKTKEQEYYYADYVLRIEKINKSQYDRGMELAKQITATKKAEIKFYPELHDAELMKEFIENNHAESQIPVETEVEVIEAEDETVESAETIETENSEE